MAKLDPKHETRYVFLSPDMTGSSGGVAVLYDCVNELNSWGYNAILLHSTRSGVYKNTPHTPPIEFSLRTRMVDYSKASWGRKLVALPKVMRMRADIGRAYSPQPNDVLVVPEFLLDRAMEAFPELKIILFVQNSFSLLAAYARCIRKGLDANKTIIRGIGISKSCLDALEMAGTPNVAKVPVSPNISIFPFQERKKKLIGFMPRKRPDEALVIEKALRERGNLGDFELIKIDGMPQAQVAEALGNSLIFISLMRREALGFPGMEAMASGCVVVGYSGFGTEEYFDNDTGVLVPEGDTMGVVRAVEDTIAAYENDPKPYDIMRERASNRIRERYSKEVFVSALRECWESFE